MTVLLDDIMNVEYVSPVSGLPGKNCVWTFVDGKWKTSPIVFSWLERVKAWYDLEVSKLKKNV